MTRLYNVIGAAFVSYMLATKCFPGAYPRDLQTLWHAIKHAVGYLLEPKDEKIEEVRRRIRNSAQTPTIGLSSPIIDSALLQIVAGGWL